MLLYPYRFSIFTFQQKNQFCRHQAVQLLPLTFNGSILNPTGNLEYSEISFTFWLILCLTDKAQEKGSL